MSSELSADGRTIKRENVTITFDRNFKELARDLGISLGVAMRKIAFDALEIASTISPVRTGRFRASWGLAPYDIPADDVGAAEHPDPQLDEAGAVSNPLSTSLQSERISIDDSTDGFAPIWLYNSIVYAVPIEEGHSQQAPDGVLNLTAAMLEAKIVKELGEIA